jgi:membrane protease YdiL (CAAX protease family)
MWWVAPVVVVVGAMGLLTLGRRLEPAHGAANRIVSLQVRYQPLAFALAVVAVIVVRVLVPDHADYLRAGDWSAPATGLGWLGVADGDSWTSVGLTFLAIMTVVTAMVLWLQVGRRGGARWSGLLRALPWAVAFSVVNALSEELLFRVTLAEALGPVLAAGTVALVSAVLFGVPHWFGSPGHLPGVLLAGFMGGFLQMSILQTGGIGWAWTIHAVQDVVIFTVLIATAAVTAAERQPLGVTA